MGQNLTKVTDDILGKLRQGKIDSELYVKWLKDVGLSEDEAERELDRLIKQVFDELDDLPTIGGKHVSI